MMVTVGEPGADRSGQGLGVEPGEGPADRGQVGEQVRRVGWSQRQRVGVGELGEGGWDRG
jgi:hypothetical protein